MAIEHERIRDIRKAAGIKTQQDFAERLGVSTETISKIEQGKNMSERLQLLRRMALKQMKTISELSLEKLPTFEDKSR